MGRLAICLLAIAATAYVAAFVAFCAFDDAPRSWDEAYYLCRPSAVLHALHTDGVGAAIRTFWETKYGKPPLCMFGTLPAMVLFGEGSLAYRVDNLLVALGALWLAYRLLRPRMPEPLAATFAAGITLAPYSLLFARAELAEVYLWAVTILFVLVLLRCDGFRHRGWTAWLGVAFGLGMLSKVSFPMVVGPPTLWLLIASLRRDGAGDWRLRLRHALRAGVIGLLIFAPFYAKNWSGIKNHFRNQFGWVGKEYSIGNPFLLDTVVVYFRAWFAWYGSLWLWLGALALTMALLCLVLGRGRRLLADWPAGALGFGFLVNLVYCYLHPVADPRFSYGAMLFLQLGTAFVLARALVALGLGGRPVALTLLAPFLVFLACNSFWASDGSRVLDVDWPVVGPAQEVLLPPVHAEDLARQVIDLPGAAGASPARIALAGDHLRLNNETIQLQMIRVGRKVDVRQMAYLGPALTIRERFQAMRESDLWLVVHDPGASRDSSWASRHAPAALALLQANPTVFRPLSWRGELPDGVQVLAFQRVAAVDAMDLLEPATESSGGGRAK